MPLNFTKRCKVTENAKCVAKQGTEIVNFYKDKRSKEFISLKIEAKRAYFSKFRGSKEYIFLKIEDIIFIFLLEGQNRNVLKYKREKLHLKQKNIYTSKPFLTFYIGLSRTPSVSNDPLSNLVIQLYKL